MPTLTIVKLRKVKSKDRIIERKRGREKKSKEKIGKNSKRKSEEWGRV